ncbi:MAG: histidine phosphatase family protein [Oscillospiraceae bacterium]|nr:histidine phosphatase family protein [Oscillospiraceae bacterium]
MTTVFFVRHAEPNFRNHDDLTRELSPKGEKDRLLVTEFFAPIRIDAVLSSPYKRAVDTVADLAAGRDLEIIRIEAFRERKVGPGWIEDFDRFCLQQWRDFSYKLDGGESLREVQDRSVNALSEVLREYSGKTLVIGGHGTALSTILNYYDSNFGYRDFMRIKNLMPWVVRLDFSGTECKRIQAVNLFESRQ